MERQNRFKPVSEIIREDWDRVVNNVPEAWVKLGAITAGLSALMGDKLTKEFSEDLGRWEATVVGVIVFGIGIAAMGAREAARELNFRRGRNVTS